MQVIEPNSKGMQSKRSSPKVRKIKKIKKKTKSKDKVKDVNKEPIKNILKFDMGDVNKGINLMELSEDDLEEGKIDIISLLVKADLAPTRSEARRNIQQGGVSVNGEKVTDIQATVAKEELVEGAVVKRGKKKFKKVVVK